MKLDEIANPVPLPIGGSKSAMPENEGFCHAESLGPSQADLRSLTTPLSSSESCE